MGRNMDSLQRILGSLASVIPGCFKTVVVVPWCSSLGHL